MYSGSIIVGYRAVASLETENNKLHWSPRDIVTFTDLALSDDCGADNLQCRPVTTASSFVVLV